MAISLGTPEVRGESQPSVKWLNVGDTVIGRIVDAKFDLPVTDLNTGQPKLNAKNRPMTQHALTVHVMAGSTAKIGTKDGTHDPQVGETAALWIGGADKYSSENPACFSTVYELHGALSVGDVIKVDFTGTKPTNKPMPLKVKAFRLRHPKPDGSEAEAVKAAEAAHAERQQAQATTLAAGQSAPAGYEGVDEEAF